MHFSAHWSTFLKLTTLFFSLLLLSIPILGVSTGPRDMLPWTLLMVVLPPVMLVITAFFAIRGYTITNETLTIKRIGWNSTVNLVGLESAAVIPDAMAGSIRTFGNGGAFCFAGKFHNKKLGAYRAFATDRKKTVVLEWSDKTVVVTPGQPDAFVEELQRQGLI